MSLPGTLGELGNQLPLVYVFKRIWEHSKFAKVPVYEIAQEFEYLFPNRADFKLARLTYVLWQFGSKFNIDIPHGEQAVAGILESAAEAIEKNFNCRDDVLRVVASTKFANYVYLGYEKRSNSWRVPAIESAVWRLFNAIEGKKIARPQGLETDIFNEILLPNVQLLLAEQLSREFKPFFSDLKNVLTGVRKCMEKLTDHRGQRLQLDNSNRLFKLNETTGLAPWAEVESEKTTTLLIQSAQGIVQLLLAHTVTGVAGNESQIREVIENAAWIQKVCWFTSRTVRFNLSDASFPQIKQIADWRNAEITSLARLSTLERMRARMAIASQYANLTNLLGYEMYSSPINTNELIDAKDWHQAKGFLSGSVVFAKEQGMVFPKSDLSNAKYENPYLAIPSMRQFSQSIDRAINNARNEGILNSDPNQRFGYPAIQALLRRGSPKDIAHGFILAYRLGFLKTAANVFAAYSPSWDQDAVGRLLTKNDFFGFVVAVANVVQNTIMFCDHETVNMFKRAIRRLWRRIPDAEQGHISITDLTFLHHVQIGLSYFAVHNHKSPELARSKTYRTSPNQIQYSQFDNFAEEIISGTTRALTIENFRNSTLSMDNESVFVSFTTCNGNKLSVVVIGPNGSSETFLFESQYDWHLILNEYRIAGCEEIRFQEARSEPYPWVSPPPRVLAFFFQVVFTALRVNPNARRLLLHCDQMWNIVSWQYLLRTSMKAKVEKTLDVLRRQGKRRHDARDFAGLLVWRVSGVLPNHPLTQPNYRPSDAIFDEDDLAYSPYGRRSKTTLEKRVTPQGHLSVFARGEQKVFTSFKMYGESVTSSELSKRCEGYDVVILHICSAADVIGTAKTGDTGGLPSLFLANGAQLVIAPTFPIRFSLTDVAEPYLQQIDQGNGFKDVERHYSNAIQENQTMAMYTLFSNELVAPRLISKRYSRW